MSPDLHETPTRRSVVLLLVLTLSRIPLAALLTALLVTQERSPWLLAAVLVLLGLIELTDLLDGQLARRTGNVTEEGAMLDPYADSVARLVVYWGLSQAGLALALVPLAMAVRDVTVATCRITLSRHGRSVAAKLSGKVKAVVQGGVAALLILGPAYWPFTGEWTIAALSWVVIVVTLLSAIQYAMAAVAAARAPAQRA
ncbi:MAG: CDP-alcohol phosphatidyltransferase family protein [Deltaproteobacteria bacterium]|nr:CDP-alcohol phosphatidyltransferase family protein [Deltaproteobacteria bacterium]